MLSIGLELPLWMFWSVPSRAGRKMAVAAVTTSEQIRGASPIVPTARRNAVCSWGPFASVDRSLVAANALHTRLARPEAACSTLRRAAPAHLATIRRHLAIGGHSAWAAAVSSRWASGRLACRAAFREGVPRGWPWLQMAAADAEHRIGAISVDALERAEPCWPRNGRGSRHNKRADPRCKPHRAHRTTGCRVLVGGFCFCRFAASCGRRLTYAPGSTRGCP